MNDCKEYGKTVTQIVKVSDDKELLPEGSCRPCDNLDDADEMWVD